MPHYSETEPPIPFFVRRPLSRAAINAFAAQLQAEAKKQGKEKKPDHHLVSLVFPGE